MKEINGAGERGTQTSHHLTSAGAQSASQVTELHPSVPLAHRHRHRRPRLQAVIRVWEASHNNISVDEGLTNAGVNIPYTFNSVQFSMKRLKY